MKLTQCIAVSLLLVASFSLNAEKKDKKKGKKQESTKIEIAVDTEYGSRAYVDRGPLGLGFYLGKPTGITGKLFFDDYSAIAVTVAFDFWQDSFNVQGDYHFHFRDMIKIETEEIIPYVGIGGYAGMASNRNDSTVWTGIRFPLGLAYNVRTFPLEIGFEAAPSFELMPTMRFAMGGGLTLRYYF